MGGLAVLRAGELSCALGCRLLRKCKKRNLTLQSCNIRKGPKRPAKKNAFSCRQWARVSVVIYHAAGKPPPEGRRKR